MSNIQACNITDSQLKKLSMPNCVQVNSTVQHFFQVEIFFNPAYLFFKDRHQIPTPIKNFKCKLWSPPIIRKILHLPAIYPKTIKILAKMFEILYFSNPGEYISFMRVQPPSLEKLGGLA